MTDTAIIHVSVVSAEEEIFDGDAEFVALPGESGELGIYPMHTPLITRIRPGAVRIKVPGQLEEELVFVAGGILEVQPDEVTVLAETAIRGHDLDEASANEARRHAEEAMRNRMGDKGTYSNVYAEAVRRGSHVLTVDVDSDERRLRAEDILRRHGAVDIDERSAQWVRQGWSGHDPQATGTGGTVRAFRRRVKKDNPPD